jgi:hypothetical protein
VLSWDAQLKDVKNEIAELRGRISALKDELRGAQRMGAGPELTPLLKEMNFLPRN